MRPINKLPVGESITLDDGSTHIIQEKYRPYQEAKVPLCHNMGKYCSYCEAPFAYARGLDVEHVLPKDKKLGFQHLKHDWVNFLLACPTCNGNGNKGNKVAKPEDCHFPHLNDTYLSLEYKQGGVVTSNPKLTGLSLRKAEALLKLTGLDKTPANSSPTDKRWMYRAEKWNLAKRYKTKYENGNLDLDCLIDYIKEVGCWSIWFTVFYGHDDVRQRMIADFPGTASQCFDPDNHFQPIGRNIGETDPV